MSTIEERTAYLNNPLFTKHLYGNFSPFYITIAICATFGISIILLNIVLTCCSKHSKYWKDRNTGNLWLLSIWTSTPHKQPPLDYTELKDASYFNQLAKQQTYNEDIESAPVHQEEQLLHHERPPRPSRHREEYVELQKRESDI